MDDNQANEPAADELLAGNEASEANPEAEKPEDEANTGTEDEGTADDSEADSSDDENEDEGEQPKRKKRSGVERLRRRVEALEAENQALRSHQPVDSGDLDKAVLAEIGDPPKESDYPDFLAYERAMIAYEADKRLVTRELKKTLSSQAAQTAARQTEVIESYNERLEEAEKAIPGLKATIAKTDIQMSKPVLQLIIESDKGPLLAHHLAKNPNKAAELSRMSPVAAAKEIGRLEARLSLPKPNTATKAPAPVPPLKGGASPSNPEKELDGWLKQRYGR